jgi:hypothetical protein
MNCHPSLRKGNVLDIAYIIVFLGSLFSREFAGVTGLVFKAIRGRDGCTRDFGVACARSRCPLDPVCGQHCLDIVPQRLVDNRRVFSGIGIAFVGYLAAVKPVLKNQIKCPARTDQVLEDSRIQ